MGPADEEKDNELKLLQDQLAAAKEKSDAKKAARDAAIQKKRMQEEVELIKIADEQELTIGIDCRAIFSPKDGRMIVIKTPKEAAYQQYQYKMQKDKLQASDSFDLLRTCLVYPTWKELQEIIEAAPGILMRAVNAAAHLSGVVDEDLGKE